MNLDIGKAFTFVSDDPKWLTKILIGGGLILAGVITLIGWLFTGFVVLGYLVQVTRNVIAGNPQVLPEWDNWGERWMDGLKAWVVGLVCSIPLIVVAAVFQIPAFILNVTSKNGASGLGTAFNLTGSCLSFFLGIAVYLLLPIAIGRYATSGSIGGALQFGSIFATLRQNIGMYIIVALLSYLAVGLVASLGVIACFVGVFFTAFYGSLVQYHLYGQAQRIADGAQAGGYGQAYGQARPF